MRYFFLREGTFGMDWDYTDDAFIRRYNADLANNFGNLLNRTVQMVVRYFDGVVPAPSGAYGAADQRLVDLGAGLRAQVEAALEHFALQDALIAVFAFVEEANKYIQATAPWELAKARKAGDEAAGVRLADALYILMDALRLIGLYLTPVIPNKAALLRRQLGLGEQPGGWASETRMGQYPAGTRVQPAQVLFPRLEDSPGKSRVDH